MVSSRAGAYCLALSIAAALVLSASPSTAQSTEFGCTYDRGRTGAHSSVLLNAYCAEDDQVEIQPILDLVQGVEDRFWESVWLKAGLSEEERTETGDYGCRVEEYRYSAGDVTYHITLDVELADVPCLSYGLDSWAFEDRKVLSQRGTAFQRNLQEADAFLADSVVTSYVDSLLRVVHPNPMLPGRPGAFQVRIVESSTPNAFALTDGTILLTTGLLAQLRSETELLAVLAHEVAHVVMDHAVISYQQTQQRQQAAQVLAGVLSVATATLSAEAGSRAGISPEVSAAIGAGAGLTTLYLTHEVTRAIGAEYSRDQEHEADMLAQSWLLHANHAPRSLISALSRIEEAPTLEPSRSDTVASFFDTHTHPDFESRVEALRSQVESRGDEEIGDSLLLDSSATYDRRIRPALVANAESVLGSGDYENALRFLQRAQATPQPTADSTESEHSRELEARGQLLKASSLRRSESKEDRQQAVELLAQLEDSPISEVRRLIEQGLAHLSLDQRGPALSVFQQLQALLDRNGQYPPILENWTRQMVIILSGRSDESE